MTHDELSSNLLMVLALHRSQILGPFFGCYCGRNPYCEELVLLKQVPICQTLDYLLAVEHIGSLQCSDKVIPGLIELL